MSLLNSQCPQCNAVNGHHGFGDPAGVCPTLITSIWRDSYEPKTEVIPELAKGSSEPIASPDSYWLPAPYRGPSIEVKGKEYSLNYDTWMAHEKELKRAKLKAEVEAKVEAISRFGDGYFTTPRRNQSSVAPVMLTIASILGLAILAIATVGSEVFTVADIFGGK